MIAERLKKSILQAAIQGKLTDQLTEDRDARDLLGEIKSEKAKLIKEGKVKKENQLPEIPEDEIPFEIPENWCWVRLQDIVVLNSGTSYAESGNLEDIPYVKVSDMNLADNSFEILTSEHFTNKSNVSEKNYVYPFSIIFPKRGGAIITNKRRVVTNVKIVIDTNTMAMTPITSSIFDYIYMWLKGINFKDFCTGTSVPQINNKDIYPLLIPLPPLPEQSRIVLKVNQVFEKIELLKKDEVKLEALRKSFPKKMKDSLLQSAIQGKLTEQLETDGKAQDLVADIQAEKERLIKEKKIKKEKPLPEITEDENPFDIPDNWCWVRLNDISQYIQRGKSPKYSLIKKYPVVAQKCNQWDGFNIEKAQFIQPESVASYGEERILQNEDLMWNSTGLGTLGRIAIYENDKNPYGFAVTDSHVTVIRTFKDKVLPRYIFSYIASPYIQSIVEDISSGSTKQKELSTDTVKKLPIPLPPLSEQYRIVNRLDQILPLCDVLK